MLNELCRELKNWFDRGQPKFIGSVNIVNGKIESDAFIEKIQNEQYFRIVGSVFNDGVYKYTDDLMLNDEAFEGAVWLMAIPSEVIELSSEIDAWVQKYGEQVNTPYTSESFGGYSYVKASSGGSNSTTPTWQSVFASRLNKWRKI